jgi:cytochrome c
VPLAQPAVATIGPLTAICRAIGLRPVASTTARQVESKAPTVSQVAWTKSTLEMIVADDPQKGRKVAQQCTPCHGEHGIVAETQAPALGPAVIPNLAQLNRAAFGSWSALPLTTAPWRAKNIGYPLSAETTAEKTAKKPMNG